MEEATGGRRIKAREGERGRGEVEVAPAGKPYVAFNRASFKDV